MPWNGSAPNKVFGRTDGTRTGTTVWTQAEGAGVDIISSDHDAHDSDVATGINACIEKNGGNSAAANLPMGGFKHTGVADATARTQYLTAGQASDDDATYYATVGGTADAITLTSNGFLDSQYNVGQRVRFIATGDNTTAATLAIGAVAADAVVLNDGANTALAGGEIQSGAMVNVQFDGTNWLLLSVHKLQSSQLGIVGLPNGSTATTQSAGDNSTKLATTAYADAAAIPALGYLYGLGLSNNGTDATNDIDIAAGEAASNDATPIKMVLSSTLTKRLDAAWTVGTNQGGLDTGAIADTTYHIWLIRRSDTGVVDALFSASATSPTMPTNYDQKRRIGSIIRASAAIRKFWQIGNEFRWDVPAQDVAVTNPGTAAVTRTLTVPLGLTIESYIYPHGLNSGGNFTVLMTALEQTDTTPDANLYTFACSSASGSAFVGATMHLKTNTSGQVRSRQSASVAANEFRIQTLGWRDLRGTIA